MNHDYGDDIFYKIYKKMANDIRLSSLVISQFFSISQIFSFLDSQILFMESVVFARIVSYATQFFFNAEKLVVLTDTVCT